MHRPHLDKAAVVDAGEQQRDHDAKHRRTGLHQRAAVIADAGNGTSDLVRGKPLPCFAAQEARATTAMVLLKMHSSR